MAAERRSSGRRRSEEMKTVLNSFNFVLTFFFTIFLFSAAILTAGANADTQFLVQLNPGAPSLPPGGDLLHVRASGNNRSTHFLFCSVGAPSVLMVHTDTNTSNVKVNWTQFNERSTSGSLQVEPESSILYSSAIVLTRLLEYNDVNNTADPATSDLFPSYDLKNFSWGRVQLSSGSKVTAMICGSAPFSSSNSSGNGSVCVQLSVFGSEGRVSLWPRLLHTPGSAQLDFLLDGLLPRATRSRFLLELLSVGEEANDANANPLERVDEEKSIDDEFTPSIFKVSQWVSNATARPSGFLLWRPVAFRRAKPALEDMTPCHHSQPIRAQQQQHAVTQYNALIAGFYSENHTAAFGLNLTFGLAGEAFYNATKFLRWTGLVGMGPPPVDPFSPLVLSMMAVGLGTPIMLLVLGAVCVCARRIHLGGGGGVGMGGGGASPSATGYEPIN